LRHAYESDNLIDSYTIVDVETPNLKNNSIYSIAVIHVRDREVVLNKGIPGESDG